MPKKNNSTKAFIGPLNKGQTRAKGGKKKPKNSARGAGRSNALGAGSYKLVGALAKMAINAALPAALQRVTQSSAINAARIQGSGDYVTNDIVHSGKSGIKKGPQGVPQTTYQHSEFIEDLVVPATPTLFTTKKYSLNVSDTTTFPWLARLGSLYTKFKFTKLLFEFRSTTSNYSAAGTLGTVIMAPHYNVDSAGYPSKQTMEASTHAVSSAPSNSIIMGFECAKRDNNVAWFNVLNDISIARSNFTDPGYVEIATTGLPGTAGTVLGEIWVHYSCELIEPYISQSEQLSTGVPTAVTSYQCTGGNNPNGMALGVFGTQFSQLASTNANSFPAAMYQKSYVSVNEPIAGDWFTYCGADAAKQLVFKYAGTYMIDVTLRLNGTPTASTGAPWDITGTSGTVTVIAGNNAGVTNITWPTPSNWLAYRYIIAVSAGAKITTTQNSGWTATTTLAPTGGDLVIMKIG